MAAKVSFNVLFVEEKGWVYTSMPKTPSPLNPRNKGPTVREVEKWLIFPREAPGHRAVHDRVEI